MRRAAARPRRFRRSPRPHEQATWRRSDALLPKGSRPTRAVDELSVQNQQLIAALEDVQARRDELLHLNEELEETNRGVMALYGQLSQELEQTNQGVVAHQPVFHYNIASRIRRDVGLVPQRAQKPRRASVDDAYVAGCSLRNCTCSCRYIAQATAGAALARRHMEQ